MADLNPNPTVVVVWIDWYAYHVARFRGLMNAPALTGNVTGLELVGGVGVHAGLKFREELPAELPVETLMPTSSWGEVDKWELSRRLWAKLSQLKPKVVLVPGYYTLPGLTAAIWARTHGAVSVLMTESTAYDHQRVGWKEAIKSFGMRLLFDWAIAGGQAHVDYLRQLHFREDRVVGCYDVVDNDFFRVGTAELRQRSLREDTARKPYFLYVGRLAAEKNVLLLLLSWFAYRASGGTWGLVLVGAGPKMEDLKARVADSPYAGEVQFPGLRSSRELLPYYAEAGCFVLPSTREPWGLVVNEAMAAGLPVLVSDRCGCAPELVEQGRNGFIFDPTERPDLTALLTRMEAQPADERAAMGAASAEIIRGFSPEGFGASVARIVRETERPSRPDFSKQTRLSQVRGGLR